MCIMSLLYNKRKKMQRKSTAAGIYSHIFVELYKKNFYFVGK